MYFSGVGQDGDDELGAAAALFDVADVDQRRGPHQRRRARDDAVADRHAGVDQRHHGCVDARTGKNGCKILSCPWPSSV